MVSPNTNPGLAQKKFSPTRVSTTGKHKVMLFHHSIIWAFLSVSVFVQSSTIPNLKKWSDAAVEPASEFETEVIPLLASVDGIENECTFSIQMDDGLLVEILKSIFTQMEPENSIIMMNNIRLVSKRLERLTHQALRRLVIYNYLYFRRYDLATLYRLLSRPRFDSVKWTESEKRLFNRILHVKNNFGMGLPWYGEVKRFKRLGKRVGIISLLWSTSIPVSGILIYHYEPIGWAIMGVCSMLMCSDALSLLARDGLSMLIPALVAFTLFAITFFKFLLLNKIVAVKSRQQ